MLAEHMWVLAEANGGLAFNVDHFNALMRCVNRPACQAPTLLV